MKKKSIADKLAEKSFASPEIKKSWAVHMKAFGPILKPAFAEDYQARVHLCAALNHISNKNLPQALLKLNGLQKHLATDADKAAFFFAMGLFCEYAGKIDDMAALYSQANDLNHTFYLPYMKVAKYAMDTRDYGVAEKNYRAAINCFTATGPDEQEKRLMGSAYTNLASCLLMMHRLEEAEHALDSSRSIYPDAPGRAAVEAAVFALRGERDQVNQCLDILKAHVPAAYDAIRSSTEKMLAKTDPQFFSVALDADSIIGFWNWFSSSEADLKSKLDKQEYEAVMTAIGDHLLEAFPFLEQRPYNALGKNDRGYVIQLKDMYAIAVGEAYRRLVDACPEDIKSRWLFDIVH